MLVGEQPGDREDVESLVAALKKTAA